MINKRLLDIVAVGGGMIGSLTVALKLGHPYVFYGYIFFLLSSLATIKILLAVKGNVKSLLLINWYFLVVNVIGIFRYASN